VTVYPVFCVGLYFTECVYVLCCLVLLYFSLLFSFYRLYFVLSGCVVYRMSWLPYGEINDDNNNNNNNNNVMNLKGLCIFMVLRVGQIQVPSV